MNIRNMCPSRVFNKLRYGEVASCFKMNLTDARAVVRMTRFLASYASVYVTGTNIPVDGGCTAKREGSRGLAI